MSAATIAGVVAAVAAVAVLLAVLAVLLFVRPGWLRSKHEVEEIVAPPTLPRPSRGTSEGRYGGTRWVADGSVVRVSGLGGKGRVLLVLTADGLVLERHGLDDLLIEESELRGAEQRGMVLAVRWQHGDALLETVVTLDVADDVGGWVTSLEQARTSE